MFLKIVDTPVPATVSEESVIKPSVRARRANLVMPKDKVPVVSVGIKKSIQKPKPKTMPIPKQKLKPKPKPESESELPVQELPVQELLKAASSPLKKPEVKAARKTVAKAEMKSGQKLEYTKEGGAKVQEYEAANE